MEGSGLGCDTVLGRRGSCRVIVKMCRTRAVADGGGVERRGLLRQRRIVVGEMTLVGAVEEGAARGGGE